MSAAKPAPVLLFCINLTIGGAQKGLLELAGWLHRRGIPVTGVFFYDRDNMLKRWQTGHPFPILALNGWKKGASLPANGFRFLGGMLRLFRLMLRGHYGTILTYTHQANLLGIPLAWLAHIPQRIASHHGRLENFPAWLNRLHSLMINSGMAAHLVCVSGGTRADALEWGVHPERISLIINGVDLPQPSGAERTEVRAELGLPPDAALVLCAGRLAPPKGQDILLHAIAALPSGTPPAVFLLAGDGPLRSEFEALALRLNLGESVRFLGFRHDTARLMAASDVYVLPSRSEGLPYAMLEAMSHGLAIVASDLPGIAEAASGDVCSLLVPPADPLALAAGLARLLADAPLRKRLGEAARRRIENELTLERSCKQYLELFSKT